MQLFTYFRSSAAYRVRIALHLKGLSVDSHYVHLTKDGGQQFAPAYRALNPQQLVPTLVDEGNTITQSLAILEYLEDTHPSPALLPPASTPIERARVRALALSIACDIHPLQNLRVLKALTGEFGLTEDQRNAWLTKWLTTGLAALEAELISSKFTSAFCHGDSPTIADCCLVPQVFSARRFNIDLAAYPTIVRIDAQCNSLDAFVRAHPKNQPDFEA
jgi:maleylpyruvate isomerase